MTLYVGRGGRTNAEGIRQLRGLVAAQGFTVVPVELDLVLPWSRRCHQKHALTQRGVRGDDRAVRGVVTYSLRQLCRRDRPPDRSRSTDTLELSMPPEKTARGPGGSAARSSPERGSAPPPWEVARSGFAGGPTAPGWGSPPVILGTAAHPKRSIYAASAGAKSRKLRITT
jgi:hypothetical protein